MGNLSTETLDHAWKGVSTESEPVTITQADASSSALLVNQLNKDKGKYKVPKEQQVHMSELVWRAFAQPID